MHRILFIIDWVGVKQQRILALVDADDTGKIIDIAYPLGTPTFAGAEELHFLDRLNISVGISVKMNHGWKPSDPAYNLITRFTRKDWEQVANVPDGVYARETLQYLLKFQAEQVGTGIIKKDDPKGKVRRKVMAGVRRDIVNKEFPEKKRKRQTQPKANAAALMNAKLDAMNIVTYLEKKWSNKKR